MAKQNLLFVSICVAVLFGDVLSNSTTCNSVSWGQQNGVKYELQAVQLSSGYRDWSVDVPKPKQCASVTGVSVLACDYDKEPDLNFQEKLVVTVHRKGDLLHVGDVKATVYCYE